MDSMLLQGRYELTVELWLDQDFDFWVQHTRFRPQVDLIPKNEPDTCDDNRDENTWQNESHLAIFFKLDQKIRIVFRSYFNFNNSVPKKNKSQ